MLCGQEIEKCLRSIVSDENRNTVIQDEALQKLWTASKNETHAESLVNFVYPISTTSVLIKVIQEKDIQFRLRFQAMRILQNLMGQNFIYLMWFPRIYAHLIAEDIVRALSHIMQEDMPSNKHGDLDSITAMKSRAAMLMVAVLCGSEAHNGSKFYELSEGNDDNSDEDSDVDDVSEEEGTQEKDSQVVAICEKKVKEARKKLKNVKAAERVRRSAAFKVLYDLRKFSEKKILFEERNNTAQLTGTVLAQRCLKAMESDVLSKLAGKRMSLDTFNLVKDVSQAIRSLSRIQIFHQLLWGAKIFPVLTEILKSPYGTEDTIYSNSVEALAAILNFAVSQKGQESELLKTKKGRTDLAARVQEVIAWSESDKNLNPMSWRGEYYTKVLCDLLQGLETKQNEKEESNPAIRGCGKHIMISYNHNHKDKAKALLAELEKLDLLVWIDEKGTDFVPAMMGETDDQMARAVEEAYCVICLVSEQYCKSPNCIKEVCM